MTETTDLRDRDPMIRTRLGVVYLVTLIAFADTFSLLPIMGPYAESLGATALGMGLVMGAYSVTDIVFNMVGGRSIDRKGRRRLALIGFLIVTGAILLYPLASSVPSLIGVRLLHGVGGGILLPALYTVIGDLARAGSTGRAMGRVGAVIGTAAVIGPAVGGVGRERYGFSAVFIGLAVVMSIGFLVTLIAIRETADRNVIDRAEQVSLGTLWAIPDLRVACVAVFGFTFGFGSLSAFFSSRLEAMGHSPGLVGMLFTLLAAVAVALMLTKVSSRVDRQGPRNSVHLGLPMIALGLILIGVLSSLGVIALGMALFGVGFGLVYPAATGATALAASAEGRGRAFGVFSVFYSMGFVIGPPTAGYLSDQVGLSPFVFAAVACLAALGVIVFGVPKAEAQ